MKSLVTISLGLLLGFSALAQQRMNGPILVPGDGGAYQPLLLGFPSSTLNGIYSDGTNLFLRASGQLLDKNGNPLGSTTINTSVNGSGYTNLTYQYVTNAIPNTGVLTFGQAYWTNMQANITLPAFTLGANFYETLVLMTTNSDSAVHTWTMPAGVRVAIANGGGNKIYCTNGTVTAVFVEHYGTLHTNAWKVDY